MKAWLVRLLGEGKNEKWYDSKGILFAVAMVVVGVLGYLDPDSVQGVDFHNLKEITWPGIISLALNFKRFMAK